MSRAYDVVVVGGGIVGASVAYHCTREGLRTLLLDRADVGRATSAGAGILSPETNPRDERAWFDFEVAAARYYDVLVEQLAAAGVSKTGYARCGLLHVAVSEDEEPLVEKVVALVLERRRALGWPADDLREVSPDEARRRFPPLAAVQRALYSRRAARVDGRLFSEALWRAAEARGLATLRAGVERIVVERGRVAGVMADGATYEAAHVVIAGGAWSPRLAADLGVEVPIEPQRGQIIHLTLPGARTDDWTIVTAFTRHYIVPWPGGRIVVGATRETGAGFEPRLTAAGVREVLTEALRVAPGLGSAGIHEMRVGLRPVSRDLRPVIDRVPTADGAFVATGHGGSGLLGGPYSGKLVCDLLLGRLADGVLDPFRLDRFLHPR
ncbi:MAG: FAD-dependent oxidoreductase [Armatimonadota bacterium]|nr:FAD-dependent oxidoreductase [Armatimonadota bacterium]MDR7422375.1 FAD-dependent oxidoreductase [Armatimonadota bacterium]MDR7454835.1 FAD-dependent oxidoreductase [Armatimonadota bacterium]MDR7457785.1 FAD-dependent oxidoreductase [Armatimonadota bacterium]MDR7497071.1 FAD-dependent oxidoreductase [Armatimonadota bacterium]